MDDAVVAFTFMKAETQIGAAQRIEPSELLSGAHQDWPRTGLADRRVVLSELSLLCGNRIVGARARQGRPHLQCV